MGSKQVSTIGLGTWQFGERGWGWGQDFDNREIERIIDRALELGINFFDTAAVYGNGRSEGILGKALQGRREKAVIATKVAPPLGPDQVKRAAEESFKRLRVEEVAATE
jgi:myo-inositol catabolism protein IolS